MQKSELLEAISILIDEEIAKVLREDKALKISDKRRKLFLKAVFSNPPAYNSNGRLAEEGILPDDPNAGPPGPPPSGDDAPVDASPEFGEPMAMPAPGGQTSDMGDALGGGGAAPTGAPGGSAGGSGGAPMDGEADLGGEEGDLGGDVGGGDAGMGGGFGGGGGGGGGMDFGDDAEGGEDGEAGPAAPEPSYDPFKDATTVSDRLQVIIDTAEEIASQTQDPQKVLKTVKGLIQNGFSRPDEAAKSIADLFDTNNPVLQQVSRRLALFMTGN